MSLSLSTDPYRCLIQVNDTFSGSFNSCASCTSNSCSVRSLFRALTNAMLVCLYSVVACCIVTLYFSNNLVISALNSLP